MRPVFNDNLRVAWFVCERIGRFVHPPFVAIGFERDGILKAGAIFNDYQPGGNIELTLACDGPMTRGMIEAIAQYVFVQLKCTRLSLTTHLENKRVVRMAKRAGFQQEGVRADYFGPREHAVLFGMKRSRCKWLKV